MKTEPTGRAGMGFLVALVSGYQPRGPNSIKEIKERTVAFTVNTCSHNSVVSEERTKVTFLIPKKEGGKKEIVNIS